MTERLGIQHGVALAALMLLAGTAAADSAPDLKPGTYTMDAGHTYGHFEIDHMGLSTMYGRMDIKSGTIRIGEDPNDSQVQLTLDPATVDTGDAARDEHLRDMDGFFDVKKYPTITFKSTQVTFDDDDADEAEVKGQLTMHGVTRPVTLDVSDIACRTNPLQKNQYTCGFSAETELKRSDFGMDAFSQLVGDEVELSFEVEADKPVGSND